MTKNIQHRVTIRATPAQVFEALMDGKKHAAFTGEPASITGREGGRFTCYGDYIRGFNLELEAGKRIVQAWRSRDWPNGLYSIVTFNLSSDGRNGTVLRFSQIGVPAGDYGRKNKGWRTHYWEPLKRFLNGIPTTKPK